MLRDFAERWWLIQGRGVLTVLFGLFLIFFARSMEGQFTTVIALVGVLLIFVAYLMASGILSILAAFWHAADHHRLWAAALYGTILAALAVWVFFSDNITVMWLLWFTVANAFATGLVEFALAHRVRRHTDAALLIVAGTMSVAISLALLVVRSARIAVLVAAVGGYAVFYGAVLVTLSARLSAIRKKLYLQEDTASQP